MSSTTKKITLKSSDCKSFEVSEPVAMESQTIKRMMEENCGNNDILILNVKSKILAMVIEYCKMHVEADLDSEFVKVNYSDYLTVKAIECSKKLFNEVNEAWGVTGNVLAKGIDYCEKHVDDAAANASSSDLKVWDAKFVRQIDMDTLCDLMLAANYLNIKGLLDLTCRAAPDQARREKEQIFFKFAIALVLFWIFFR
ncbi:putative S-phase kinase-associated protein [Medicago truncatula]|uniref:SKP1-like protein n=1 Tax=Medicago truncatula TaxID=3880 RepID=A0A072U3H3_MEDTR|nr:SKP1-like protein 1B [Medicago truncatula]KEH23713.1 SCF ubiquitin ligase, SKP1 component [Medicago truncatula]RHN48033.1 putative S-phase kinase-associated protein [Medicago truncatula]